MRSVVLASILALVAVSCGGSSSDDTTAGTGVEVATETSEVAVTEAPTTTDTPVTEAPAPTDAPTTTEASSSTETAAEAGNGDESAGGRVDVARLCALRDQASDEADIFWDSDIEATGQETVEFFDSQASLTREMIKVADLELVASLTLIANGIDQLSSIVVSNDYDLDASETDLNTLYSDEGLETASDNVNEYMNASCNVPG